MPSGGRGDHPLTDILIYKRDVYGYEIDSLIRKIAELSSRRELDEWWDKEIGWAPNKTTINQKVELRYQQLVKRAKENGWEPA